MEPVMLPHQAFAFRKFREFILLLEGALQNYYYTNRWLSNPDPTTTGPTDAFICGLTQEIVTCLAGRYCISSDDLKDPFTPDKFALITATGYYEDPPYPLGINLVGFNQDLSNYLRDTPVLLDRLMRLYAGVAATGRGYRHLSIAPNNLIKMVLFSTFGRMAAGDLNGSIRRPAIDVCYAWAFKAEAQLAYLPDPTERGDLEEGQLTWIPVVPPDATMDKVMDQILGFDVGDQND